MKRTLIALLALCLALSGCSVQRRAERKVRRAVELCPGLVQLKAHPIDTVLTLSPPPDSCRVPISALHQDGTITVSGQNGTFTAHADTAAIAIAYRPDTLLCRYADTVWLPQVTVEAKETDGKHRWWSPITGFALGGLFSFAVLVMLLIADDVRKK